MNQNQHQRQASNFTFQSSGSQNQASQNKDINMNDPSLDQNFLFTIGSLQQELEAFRKDQQIELKFSPQKKFAPIKKEELQKVFKFFKKYEPIYFSKVLIKQFSLKFKKGVYIKKYKQGYYFGEVQEIKDSQQVPRKIKHGRGVFVYGLFEKSNNQMKRIYQGEWQEDQKKGLGFQKFADGSVYHGHYHDNKPQGRGKFTNSQGQIYQGEWKNGVKEGKGFWQGLNGQTYMGQFKQGKPQGYGVLVSVNGDRYEGQFKKSMKYGQGIQKFANGDIYKGSFENNKPGGYGQYYWKNKSYFKGYFSNGLRTGLGLWKRGAGNCDKYQGQYQNDKKWGYGVFTWANGNVFKGNYEGDVRNGYGQMFWNDGSYYKGQWKNGVQHGKGQLYIEGEGLRIGLFQNNQIIQIEYEEPCQDLENEENQLPGMKNSQQILLRDVSKKSNISIKSKSSKYSALSKQKTAIQEKKTLGRLKSKASQISLNKSMNKQPHKFFSQSGIKSMPLKSLLENAEESRYYSKSKHQKPQQFRITQVSHNINKLKQSLDNSRISDMQKTQKRKNRILHSSFYLHKFRKMRSPQKQLSEQKRNYHPFLDN